MQQVIFVGPVNIYCQEIVIFCPVLLAPTGALILIVHQEVRRQPLFEILNTSVNIYVHSYDVL